MSNPFTKSCASTRSSGHDLTARRDCAPGLGGCQRGWTLISHGMLAGWCTGPAPAAGVSARFEHFAERGRVLGQLGQCIGKIGEHYVDDAEASILGVLKTELQRPDNLIKVVS